MFTCGFRLSQSASNVTGEFPRVVRVEREKELGEWNPNSEEQICAFISASSARRQQRKCLVIESQFDGHILTTSSTTLDDEVPDGVHEVREVQSDGCGKDEQLKDEKKRKPDQKQEFVEHSLYDGVAAYTDVFDDV